MYKFIGRILVGLCMTVMMGSCIYDSPEGIEDGIDAPIDKNMVVLQLNIKSLAVSATDNPVEKIKSLRVVIVGKGDGETPESIECNTLINVPDMPAKEYSYIFRWNSKPGAKDIFVLANESSVSGQLTTQLNSYREKSGAGGFDDWLENYNFSPNYDVDTKNNVFLPYSYCYRGLTPKPGEVNTINAWLVPVAAKFIFNFINKRTNAVKVKGISMSYANVSNYLLAHLGKDEITKKYNGKSLYWVDWLAEISKNSWGSTSSGANDEYNKEVGWISEYYLPYPNDSQEYIFVREGSEDVFEVDGATKTEEEGVETVNPGKHTTPVYYLPESVNYRRPGEEVAGQNDETDTDVTDELKEQRFYLTLLMEDAETSTAPDFNNVAIPNLLALFRNTYVIIDFTMTEGEIDVYAEIAQWNYKRANGWLNEGTTAPPNNPFRIRKKW